jgi:hypothetical protein
VLSGGGPKWSGHSQIFFFDPLATPLVRLRHIGRALLPSIPSPPLCFYSSFSTKKKDPFFLEFSQSYQGAKLNFKKTKNRDEYFNHLLLDIIRYQVITL